RRMERCILIPFSSDGDGKCKSGTEKEGGCNESIDEGEYLKRPILFDAQQEQRVHDVRFDHHQHRPPAKEIYEMKSRGGVWLCIQRVGGDYFSDSLDFINASRSSSSKGFVM